MDSTSDPIFLKDRESRILMGNAALFAVIGKHAEEVLGKNDAEFYPDPAIGYAIIEHDRRMMESGQTEVMEEIIQAPDGNRIYLSTKTPWKDKDGRIIGIIGISRDITDRKMAEEQLTKTLESIRDGFFAVDEDWRFVYVNAMAEQLLGIDRTTAIGKIHWEVFPLTLGTRLEVEYRRAAAGEIRDFENFYEPWGRWFHNSCYPREGGGMSVYFQDITGRKRTEDALKEKQKHKLEFYQRTILAATDGKLVITEREEIKKIAGPPAANWEIRDANDTRNLRHSLEEIARSAGIEEPRLGKLLVAVGEAATNALKHAPQGEGSVHLTQDSVIVMVSDQGAGIPDLALPDVALRRGYSTAGTLGMGYKMMIQFADTIYLATGMEGTVVGIEMRLHPVELPADAGHMERFRL
jgi:PAS domain S-box-containing protein